ncbi:SycD/LcrH family type III secretion system chaperone [Estrella lausannensis]|uniref:Type III secretion chaperone SycD/LcrH n=1 Tax=Estrella lausannensis TaxID=483423 RepID=A0A0H5DPN1_9BACT|nr:SycD/LcrH family type III secretion system chaperone [Estrella lausannensis]CRX38417.1 Type III secretion chaperone SycD/LcrH [Estrella lausannensis]
MENLEEFEIPKEIKERLKDPDVFRQHILEGKSLQEILGFDDGRLELFYQKASSLYGENRFQEAREAFTFLTTLNPFVANFWVGLGMAEQRLEEFNGALLAFAMAMMADSLSPLPHYHTALCYRSLGDHENALSSLDLALMRVMGNEEWRTLREKALMLKERIKGEQEREKE